MRILGYKVNRTNSSAFTLDHVAMHNFIYNTLKEGKPIICSVTGLSNAGHEVIVDGCDKNGFFHINFGWGGSSDGYFRTNAAINAGSYTFGGYDSIIVAEPDYEMKGESTSDDLTTGFICITDVYGHNTYSEENTENDLYFNSINYNYRNPCAMEIGIRIAISDSENKYLSLYGFDAEGEKINISDEYISSTAVKVKYVVELASKLGLEKGTYKCYPAYKKDNIWRDCIIQLPLSPLYIKMIIKDDGSIVFTTPDVRNTVVKVEDKTICIEDNCSNYDVHIFNTYGLCVFSGKEDKIKVPSAGIYTVKIGYEFYKTLIVR